MRRRKKLLIWLLDNFSLQIFGQRQLNFQAHAFASLAPVKFWSPSLAPFRHAPVAQGIRVPFTFELKFFCVNNLLQHCLFVQFIDIGKIFAMNALLVRINPCFVSPKENKNFANMRLSSAISSSSLLREGVWDHAFFCDFCGPRLPCIFRWYERVPLVRNATFFHLSSALSSPTLVLWLRPKRRAMEFL